METQEIKQNNTTASAESVATDPVAPATSNEQPATDAAQTAVPAGTRAEHVREALALLYEHFPQAFIREGDAKPLKIGIIEDLRKEVPNLPGMTLSKLRSAVRLYCTRLRYLYSMREGAARINLQGNEVETVSAEHAKYAKERFEQVNEERKKRQTQRAEEAKAQKEGKPLKADGAQKRPFNKNAKRPFNKHPNNKFGANNQRFNKFKKPGFTRAEGESSDASTSRPVRKPMVRVSASSVRRGLSTRSFGVPATEADLHAGTAVLVLNNNHYMKGSVVATPKDGNVRVQLSTGLIMALPLDRVLLPGKTPSKE